MKNKGDPKYTREIQEIYNIHKRHTRDFEREKQEYSKGLSRAFKERVFQANFSTLIKSSFKAFNQSSPIPQAFIQLFIHLEEIQKGILHLSKVHLMLYSLI